ncbi:MAG: patatin-like phospholipase family protein [Betaproteobacteria bacterium]|nr:patatin-like phospholipase family protein [Betaproteobacteria bacterium]
MTSTPGPTAKNATCKTLHVDLALQGGGSHGAFTWGVLDRLLEEEWLLFEGISGTSAGAMNAAVLAHGYTEGGAVGARAALEHFWSKVADAGIFSPFQRTPLDILAGRWTLDNSPFFVAMDMLARAVSPYFINPLGFNPLRFILEDSVDFSHLADSPIKLFITATNVRTGRGRVFRNGELSTDVLLASACLPTMFQAIEIEGESYWDGGYSGNPTITPLVRECDTRDIVLVQINPVERPGTLTMAREIQNRLNEVSFNAVLLKELRMIALLHKMMRKMPSMEEEDSRWASMRIHRIADDVMVSLGHSSKLNTEWAFLTMLRDVGRQAATKFLAEHGHTLGYESSFDIDALLEGV